MRTLRTVLALGMVSILVHVAPARADLERSLDDPTNWWWLHGVSAAEIDDLINTEGARLVDVEVESDSPLRFSAAFVHNSGAYGSGWWWLYGQSPTTLSNFVAANNARIIDLERYPSGTGVRYAAVMVPNTGSQAKAWWWYTGQTQTQVSSLITANNGRIVDLESYQIGSTWYHDVVMIRNTGADASSWWWFTGQTLTGVQNQVASTGGRILDLETYTVGSTQYFDVVLKANPSGQYWWWWNHLTESSLTDIINQYGSRIADIEPYTWSGSKRFAVMMLNNSNELTTEIATQLGYGSDGVTGFHLKEVNGPVLASINADFEFEPSSTLKVIHHFHALREVMQGGDNLQSLMNYSTALTGSCPTGGTPFLTQSLSSTLSDMMLFSDNAATMAIKDRYGVNTIVGTAHNVAGMSSVQLTRDMGCPPPFNDPARLNRVTLTDLSKLYERIANGILLSGSARDSFYELMQSHHTPDPDQWWFTNDLETLVVEEATALGIPNAAPSFLAEMEFAWKPGGDSMCLPDCREYRSVAGWVSLPRCVGGQVRNEEYTFGLFLHEATNAASADSRLLDVTKELFRDLIRDALSTCPTATPEIARAEAPVQLAPNVPNPFNPRTNLRFSLAEAAEVRLEIYDLRGRLVDGLFRGNLAAGDHSVPWGGRDASGRAVASGTYMVRIDAGGTVDTRSIVLSK